MGLGKIVVKGVTGIVGLAFGVVDALATAVFSNAKEIKANSKSYSGKSNQELKEIFESDTTSMTEKAGAVRQMNSRKRND